MAAVSDCFSLGSTVWCKTCYDKEIEGEVLAFDPNTKVLILKCLSVRSQSSLLYDVHFVNLQLVSELQVKREVTTVPEIPPNVNLNKLSLRAKQQIENKRKLLGEMKTNVSPEGQRLFIAINKTISEVRWDEANICVWENVRIAPPYRLDDVAYVAGKGNPTGYAYVRKVVEKHLKDTAAAAATAQ